MYTTTRVLDAYALTEQRAVYKLLSSATGVLHEQLLETPFNHPFATCTSTTHRHSL